MASFANWTVGDVSVWLDEVGLSGLKAAFSEQQIDGSVLFTLTESDLEKIGVSAFGTRRKLTAALQSLRAGPTSAAAARKTESAAALRFTSAPAPAELVATQRISSDLSKFFPSGHVEVSLSDALKDAGVPDASEVAALCLDVARRAEASGTLRGTGLSIEHAAFVPAYTFDSGTADSEHNPYRLLNTALFERNVLKMHRVRGLLLGLLAALRSLPRFSSAVLYRGIRARVPLDDAHYHTGNKITWHCFSSTSTDLAVTKTFLTSAATGKCEGTLFIIRGAWGYDLKPFSFFDGEREILLEPEIDFKVVSVLDTSEALAVVELEMVPCPLLLEKEIRPRSSAQSSSAPSGNPPLRQQQAAQKPQQKAELRCRVMFDLTADEEGELSIREGDILSVEQQDPSGWWECRTQDGRRGLVPSNYVELVSAASSQSEKPQAKQAPPKQAAQKPQQKAELRCKVMFDYTADGEGELSVFEGDILSVEQQDPSGWWECRTQGGRRGFIPSNYVELVSAAPSQSEKPQAKQAPPKQALQKLQQKAELRCKVMFDYTADGEGELSVKEGDILSVEEQDPSGWWACRTQGGRRGFIPSNYVELI